MPYREKIAWLSLAAIAVTFGPYFALVAAGTFDESELPNLRLLGVFATVAILQAVILIVGHLVLRHRSPEEAREPLDERDRAIRHRAITASYYLLMAGMILVGCVMPFVAAGWKIVNTALFMIIVAEVVGYGMIAASYRRQA